MVSRAKKQCENTYKNVKDVMTAQYSELHTLLDENQQQAFLLLKAERDSLKEGLIQLAEDADSYRQRFESIRKNIEELDRRQDSYNLVVLLAETEVQLLSLETINHFYSNVERRMKVDGMRMSTLEKSITKIVQKNKTLLPQPWEFSEAITFDPDKKHKDLTISEDKTQVSLRGSFTKQSKDCRAASANILASESFSTGKHYWEVDVGGCQNWSVGVAENGWVKNGVGHTTLGRDDRSWLLESNEGNLTGVHHNDVSTISEASVQRLGVLVDCDMAKVNFYDALTGMKLHTLSMNFQSVVVPAFSIRHMGERKNSKLVICNLKSTGDYLGVMLTPRIHRQ
ncbi:probable E3 ubiquitin-protein ligase TRIML1 [Electrophorus electricus]|uniref:probable E3 ubiquitin-protein ligase TRIML1 n=1 Tax=Electrophorus electricus TaxID=8005 RepID=UPI0015D006A0|nr:probable E3 ubiquitin-protein ligase TRIML1 [Electrophorus electricus]XP_035382475.1 probable E3 ubiquitin-protein ligase TRIML1 [Electrophorus electricus]